MFGPCLSRRFGALALRVGGGLAIAWGDIRLSL
jgi:hypothetical protein